MARWAMPLPNDFVRPESFRKPPGSTCNPDLDACIKNLFERLLDARIGFQRAVATPREPSEVDECLFVLCRRQIDAGIELEVVQADLRVVDVPLIYLVQVRNVLFEPVRAHLMEVERHGALPVEAATRVQHLLGGHANG